MPRTTLLATLAAASALAACDAPAVSMDAIPEAVTGRWGLTANDCDPAFADAAKGLMVVEPEKVTFYESRGTLTQIVEADESRVVADFDFSGEGQTWTRQMVLDVQDDGATLIRRDYGEDAMPGPLKYINCETVGM